MDTGWIRGKLLSPVFKMSHLIGVNSTLETETLF
jgi:hypothetical protein